MTSSLPPNLLRLFEPRPPLPFKKPLDHPPGNRRSIYPSGVAEFMHTLHEGFDADYKPYKTPLVLKQERIDKKKRLSSADRKRQEVEWDPHTQNRDQKTRDPFKTLFVGRISPKTSEQTLLKEFSRYGKCSIKFVYHKMQPSIRRTYAFVEYDDERDMREAFRMLNGIRIDGSRLIVDVERGRTVKTWKPRRLGGGLGGWKDLALTKMRERRARSRRRESRFGGPRRPERGYRERSRSPKRRRY